MATFAVSYTYRPDSMDARMKLRPGHLEFLEGLLADGRIIVSGRLEAGGEPGALLIIAGEPGDTVAEIAELMDGDPFSRHDLLSAREVREWSIVFGSLGTQAAS